MFKRLSILFAGLALTAACSASPADGTAPAYTEGQQYVKIATPQRVDPKDGKVEVVEVFSYGCVHCAHYEPKVEELQKQLPKGVVFRVIPAAFNDAWTPFAQAYYAEKALNVPAAAHGALFKAKFEDHYPINSLDEIASWFAASYGVNKDKFLAAANSDATQKRILADTKLIQAWGIDGTPTIVVNGKYRSASIKDFDELNGVAKYLVDKELKGGK